MLVLIRLYYAVVKEKLRLRYNLEYIMYELSFAN